MPIKVSRGLAGDIEYEVGQCGTMGSSADCGKQGKAAAIGSCQLGPCRNAGPLLPDSLMFQSRQKRGCLGENLMPR
jgi:hypothetical protein